MKLFLLGEKPHNFVKVLQKLKSKVEKLREFSAVFSELTLKYFSSLMH